MRKGATDKANGDATPPAAPAADPLIRGVGCCENANERFRPSHEDAHCVDAPPGADVAFFGVYDGHGGADVAQIVAKELHVLTRARLAAGESPSKALCGAFEAVDKAACASGLADYCGATSVAALVGRTPTGGRVITAANAGDARCVLVVFGPPLQCEPLSFDHLPSVASESERITCAGGTIARGRVMGVLAVSRAIGDERLKPYVTATPDSSSTRLDAGQRACLLLYCDGVSNVMTDTDVTRHVAAAQRQLTVPGQALAGDALAGGIAASLVQEALLRGSRDNVTAVAVLL